MTVIQEYTQCLLLPHLQALALSKPQRAIVIAGCVTKVRIFALSLGRFGIPADDPHFGDRRGILLGAVKLPVWKSVL